MSGSSEGGGVTPEISGTEVPELSLQPPSPEDSQQVDPDYFYDTQEEASPVAAPRRRGSFRLRRKPEATRSVDNLLPHQTVSSPNLPLHNDTGVTNGVGASLHRSSSSHAAPGIVPALERAELPSSQDNNSLDVSSDLPTKDGATETSLPSGVARPESTRSSDSGRTERGKDSSKRARRTPWYSLLKNSYKHRCDEFRRLFDVPPDERLIVDYSCAQVDVGKMIYHGRLYISQNYICFTSNIFKWNVSFCVPLCDVRSVTKMNVLVFPSGINIETATEKLVLSSFASRDRAFVNIENIWRNCIEKQVMPASQMWQWVHNLYGSELGLTSDDDDYVDPSAEDDSSNKPVRHTAREFYHSVGARLEADSAAGSDLQNVPPAAAAALRSTRDEDESDTTEDEPPAACCDGIAHVGRHVTSLELPLHVDQVFTLLFTHSDFSEAFTRERKYYDVVAEEWRDGEGGNKVRSIRFQIDVNHPLGKTTSVNEQQTMHPISQAGYLYVVDAEVNNTGVPMAEVFYITKHYCLSKLSARKTRLNIWCQTKFKKSTLFKGFIEKTTNDGMDEHHNALNQMLLETTGEASKHKRGKRRRAGSKAGTGDGPPDGPAQLSPRGSKGGGESRTPASDTLLAAVMLLMLLLVVMNGYLYWRMSWLGQQTEAFAHRDIIMASLKHRPGSVDECLRVVQQQEKLHRTELDKWQQVVNTVTSLLKESEKSLAALQTMLESHRTREGAAPDVEALVCGLGDPGCPQPVS